MDSISPRVPVVTDVPDTCAHATFVVTTTSICVGERQAMSPIAAIGMHHSTCRTYRTALERIAFRWGLRDAQRVTSRAVTTAKRGRA